MWFIGFLMHLLTKCFSFPLRTLQREKGRVKLEGEKKKGERVIPASKTCKEIRFMAREWAGTRGWVRKGGERERRRRRRRGDKLMQKKEPSASSRPATWTTNWDRAAWPVSVSGFTSRLFTSHISKQRQNFFMSTTNLILTQIISVHSCFQA